ncbi:MAG: DUF559 domain-containing protein [Chitinispirillaceae bacterium]|nr:DUF559 domain-containing protein [Chitinispirillaceae bacterium]
MEQLVQDARRRAVFEARGLKELRFRNNDVLYNTTNCINTIRAIVEQRIATI